MSNSSSDPVRPTGIHHVRLTVTDIVRSKAFYAMLLGSDPAIDSSDQVDEPGAREDPERYFGGCIFAVGDQLLGLRPVAQPGETFRSTRVGLDHVSLAVPTRADLDLAAERLDVDGVPHGQVIEFPGRAILSLQDPDDINLELTAPLG